MANIAESVWGAYGIVIRALILLAAYSGMRAAELWGLRWRDIDARAGVIHVRWQLETLGDERLKQRLKELRARDDAFEIVPGGLLTRPKNQEPRTIVLFPEAAEALGDLPRHIDSDFVFLTIRGKLFTRVPQLVVTRIRRNRPWLLAFSDFVQLVRVCPRPEWLGGGVARRLEGCFRRAVAR